MARFAAGKYNVKSLAHNNKNTGVTVNFILITAIGVGGATVLGGVFGFLFKNLSERLSGAIMSFAAGVMLSASIFGLIIPALEDGSFFSLVLTILGILGGSWCIRIINRAIPLMYKKFGGGEAKNARVILFVIAITIHNIPEGIAAGVGFGSENTANALMIAGGIALQNLPEGMVLIAPMLAAGFSPRRTFATAVFTGVVEIICTVLGYLAVGISGLLLPFLLAFAAGTMLFVICDEMIPETLGEGADGEACLAFLIGFSMILLLDFLF